MPAENRTPVLGSARLWLLQQVNRRSHEIVPLVCIFVAVLLANLPGLLHVVTSNPQAVDAYLGPGKAAWLPGRPYIDPNSGFTTQALGHLATLDWLHGHIPWWNPYEGLGAPLAGEMQSGAFFLPTFLLLFHQGMLYLQIFLETATGWATYLLVRRLGVGRTFSIAGGVAFGLCGSYAWLTHAPVRPILLLPLSLLGVERALTAARERRAGGWRLLAVALAFSILAGFPETTFIDGLFVVWWAVLRMSGPGRDCWRPMVTKLAAGLVAGVALAAPLLVAFLTFLPHANLGGHGPVEAHASLPPAGLSQLLLPYSLGPINGFRGGGILTGNVDTITALWGSVGGYLTVTLVAAGLVGVVGRRNRRLRVGLGLWVLLCLLRTFGFGPVVWLMAGTPGINSTAFYRYADASWELAIVVLAVLGMDDIARRLTPRRVLVRSALLTAGLVAWAGAAAWGVMGGATTFTASHHGRGDPYIVASWALAGVVLVALTDRRLAGGPQLRFRPQSAHTADQAARAHPGRRRHLRRVRPVARLHLWIGATADNHAAGLGGLAAEPPRHLPVRDLGPDSAQLRLLLRDRPSQHHRLADCQRLGRLRQLHAGHQLPDADLHRRGHRRPPGGITRGRNSPNTWPTSKPSGCATSSPTPTDWMSWAPAFPPPARPRGPAAPGSSTTTNLPRSGSSRTRRHSSHSFRRHRRTRWTPPS